MDSAFKHMFWRSQIPIVDDLNPLSADGIDDTTFRLLAENIPTLCWIANGDGYIVWYNRRWHDYCGTTPAEMEGWGWRSVHDPALLPTVMERWVAAIMNGEPFEMTFPLKGSDGVFRPFLTRIQPVRDGSGKVARWFGVNTEISDQVTAEEALGDERSLSRGVLEAVPGVVFVKDRQGRMLAANRGTAELIGKRPSDFLGLTDIEFLEDKAQAAIVMANDRRIMETGVTEQIEEAVQLANGASAIWLSTKSPLLDREGTVIGLIGSSVDITDQVRARAVLTRSSEQLEIEVARRTEDRDRLWRNSRDLLIISRFDGTIMAVNPAWTAVLGWREDELVGTTYMRFVHPEDAMATAQENERLAVEGRTSSEFENRYRTKDGSWVWLSWSVVSENGLCHSSARDISERKRRQVELDRAQEQLQQSQKLEAIGQLTGGVAHDFNNLLTVIRGSVDILRRGDLAEEKRTRYINAIGETADRAAALTGQLLAFARRQALTPELFDAGKSVTQIAEMIRTLVGSGVALDIQLPDEPCFIVADRSQFDSTLVNLAINARDAMNGEGRLTITTGAVSGIPEIRAHSPVEGDFVAVKITDTGTGIKADDIDRIFEPFFTTKDVGKGTGLGLSQVLGFAKQSGGDIGVSCVEGDGTTFTLYLPRCYTNGIPDQDQDGDDVPINGEGMCVLLVEDNDQVGAFASQALQELGYDSVHAVAAAQALDELTRNSERFHVVFSDVVMPGMSGLELAQEVRRLYPDIPVVLTSGYSHVLAQNGSHGFELLHKPYSVELLSRVLRKATRWRDGRIAN